jgi:hypothetical protein
MWESEEARAVSHGVVLFQNAGILHGHLKVGKGNHPRARSRVFVEERRSPHFFLGFSSG